MYYEPTEAESNGLSGDEMAVDETQAVYYEQQQEWEQAHYHHEQEPEAWEEGEYEQMIFEVEGYQARLPIPILSPGPPSRAAPQ